MTLVIAAVTQEPAFVGWVAVLSVLIFMAVTYLVLVVAVWWRRGSDRLDR